MASVIDLMTTARSIISVALLPFMFSGIMLLGGCKPANSVASDQRSAKQADGVATQSVMIDSVNYMHERGVKYTVYDLSDASQKAIGGAIVDMLGTGGEKGCCLALPTVWRSDFRIRLDWEEADYQRIYPQKYSREMEIPYYARPADLYVIFHPSHEVELVVSPVEPGHPDWPGRVKATPWEHCLAQHERKVCKAALPKQFDAKTFKGYCPRAIKNGWSDVDDACAFLMHQCMQDYEDEPFCKDTLWKELPQ